ncbi:Acid protease [Mycena venus]|uniref:Acid protease n=1 Tax=Mycena venus TaxID=2733690 RepID=A0A8H6XQZ5_9AGAR|nr:Acid protease [Mycena venus]
MKPPYLPLHNALSFLTFNFISILLLLPYAAPDFPSAMAHHVMLLKTSGIPAQPTQRFAATRAYVAFRYQSSHSQNPQERRTLENELTLNQATIDQNEFFYTEVAIGTPPQYVKMIIDTGFSDIWVVGTSCTAGCPSPPLYNSSASSTAANQSAITSVYYQDGLVTGYLFTDTISLGPYTIPEIGFMQAKNTTGGLLGGPIAGLIGLGFEGSAVPGLPATTTTLFWQAVIAGGQAAAPVVGMWLARGPSETGTSNGGALSLGAVNASLFSGVIEFLPTTGTNVGMWILDISAMTVQGKTIKIAAASAEARFDTTSSVITGPADQIAAIWAAVPGAKPWSGFSGSYIYPCTTKVNITISFGGRIWPLNPADVNFGPEEEGSSQCIGTIAVTSPGGPDGWVLGNPFLKNVYTVFQVSPAAIGLAKLSILAGGTGTPNSTSSSLLSIGSISSVQPSSTDTGNLNLSSTTALAPSSTNTVTDPTPIQKKSHIGAIAGGVLGAVAVALLLFLLGFCLRRGRHRTEKRNNDSDVQPFADLHPSPPAPLSVGAGQREDQRGVVPVFYPGKSVEPATRMKREQEAAGNHHGFYHSATNSLVQTSSGLQLSPGEGLPQRSNSERSIDFPASSSEAVQSSSTTPRQSHILGPPQEAITQAALLREMVREEVRLLNVEHRDLAEPPPSYYEEEQRRRGE